MGKRYRKKKKKKNKRLSRHSAVQTGARMALTEQEVGLPTPMVSPEEFGKLRDEFIAGIPERLEVLKGGFVSLMAPFDAFDVLTNLLIANLPLNAETYRESEHEGLVAFVEYAALILLERPSRAGSDADT